jgi:hypothetical protein
MFGIGLTYKIDRLRAVLRKSIAGLQDSHDDIRNKLSRIDMELHDRDLRNGPGLIETVSDLKRENEKLKAIVAELCDYVYRENK